MKLTLWRIFFIIALACGLIAVRSAWGGSIVLHQTTIGAASNTQVISTDTYCRAITFQNNAANSMRIGDSTTSSTKGVLLDAASGGSAGGSYTIGPVTTGSAYLNLASFYVAGTQSDVLDVSCVQ